MNTTYKEIISTIGAQLNLRKKTLMWRTFIIVWPALLAIGIGYLGVQAMGKEAFTSLLLSAPYIYVAVTYVIFALIYSWFFTFVFETEKNIWIDSFFDKRELTPDQSSKISKKLFKQTIHFRVRMFFKYQLLIQLLVLLFIASIIFVFTKGATILSLDPVMSTVNIIGSFSIASNMVLPIVIGYFVVLLAVILVLSYYVRIKTRYSWFIFLDHVTLQAMPRDVFLIVVTEMNALNEVSKTEAFKKALILNLGTDAVGSIVSATTTAIVGAVSIGVGALAQNELLGKMTGDMAKTYADQLVQQAKS